MVESAESSAAAIRLSLNAAIQASGAPSPSIDAASVSSNSAAAAHVSSTASESSPTSGSAYLSQIAARCVHKIGARLHELRLDQLVRPGTGELDAMVSMSNALRLLNLTGSWEVQESKGVAPGARFLMILHLYLQAESFLNAHVNMLTPYFSPFSLPSRVHCNPEHCSFPDCVRNCFASSKLAPSHTVLHCKSVLAAEELTLRAFGLLGDAYAAGNLRLPAAVSSSASESSESSSERPRSLNGMRLPVE